MRDLGPILPHVGVSLAVLASQKDLGSALLFSGLFVAMLYVATERDPRGSPSACFSPRQARMPPTTSWHVQQRVELWRHAFDPRSRSRCRASSPPGSWAWRPADSSGPASGRGCPDLTPFAESGSHRLPVRRGGPGRLIAIIALYVPSSNAVSGPRSTATASRQATAAGLAFSMALQCFVVVGGVTRVIPADRPPTMPFLSQGGSEPAGQLDPSSPPPAHQRPGAGARPRRSGDGLTSRWWPGVNAPIRRPSLLAALLFLSLLSRRGIQYVDAKDQRHLHQPAHAAFNYTQQRGARDDRRRRHDRLQTRVGRVADLGSCRGQALCPRDRVLSFSILPDRVWSMPRTTSLRAQRQALSSPGLRPSWTGCRARRCLLELTLDPCAPGGCRHCLGSQCGAVVAPRPEHRSHPAMASATRHTTRISRTTHDSQTAGEAWDRVAEGHGSPGPTGPSPGTLSAGLDVQVITAVAARVGRLHQGT